MAPEIYTAKLENNGILCWSYSGMIRMVTDNTVSSSDVQSAIDALNHSLKE